jgi:Ino eighty subunit 2
MPLRPNPATKRGVAHQKNEQMETINRLLRKQSRPRNRRNVLASAEDRTENPSAVDSDAEDGSESRGAEPSMPPPPARTWRWVSTAVSVATPLVVEEPVAGSATVTVQEGAKNGDISMTDASAPSAPDQTSAEVPTNATLRLALGVPFCALGSELPAQADGGENGTPTVTLPDPTAQARAEEARVRERAGALCAVQGCGQARKYRLVADINRGACGMPHLKLLQGAA